MSNGDENERFMTVVNLVSPAETREVERDVFMIRSRIYTDDVTSTLEAFVDSFAIKAVENADSR